MRRHLGRFIELHFDRALPVSLPVSPSVLLPVSLPVALPALFCVVLVAVISLGGCAGTPHPSGKPAPSLTFAHYEPLYVNAADVSVTNRVQLRGVSESPAGGAEVMEGEGGVKRFDPAPAFITPLDRAIETYIKGRFLPAAGGSGFVELIIAEASITQELIESDKFLQRLAGLGRQEAYTLRAKIAVRQGGGAQAQTMELTQTRHMMEDVTLAEREMVQARFLELFIRDLDYHLIDLLRTRMRMDIQ